MNAHETYTERRKLIEKEIEILKQKLESMDICEKQGPRDWGYSGNAGYILDELQALNYSFLEKY